MKFNEHLKENHSIIAIAIIALVLILVSFRLGVFVGQKQAEFSYRWGENYHQNFGGPNGGFMQDLRGQDFIAGHGNVGRIIKKDSESLIIQDRDNIEKIIKVDPKTVIKNGRKDIKINELKIDDGIIVLGSPQDDGNILARLIRVFNLDQNPEPMPKAPIMPIKMPRPNFGR